jgi:hypothetical protein
MLMHSFHKNLTPDQGAIAPGETTTRPGNKHIGQVGNLSYISMQRQSLLGIVLLT